MAAQKTAASERGLESLAQLCSDVSRTCGAALNNENIGGEEIGEVLDRTDRMLFRLCEGIPGDWFMFRRRSPALARRVREVSEQVYRLRNRTARFLIRCQGPSPLAGRLEGEARLAYYHQALETFGFEARRIWRELDAELNEIGEDIQRLAAELEQ